LRIVVTGATGFIGRALVPKLLARGAYLTLISSRTVPFGPAAGLRHLMADTRQAGAWQEAVNGCDAVINLAGRTIFGRWSRAYKQELLESRVLTTQQVVAALPSDRPCTLISASAVGYYGSRGDEPLTEAAAAGTGFLAELSARWEQAALQAEVKGTRVVLPRFAVVLGREGGALKQMLSPYRFFVGGPLGDGRHWFSWIHLEDLLAALLRALDDPALRGAFNCCAPEPVRNGELAANLGRRLHRPAWVSTPALALRLALGELAEVLLASQRVIPTRLMEYGFSFRFPSIDRALEDLLAVTPGSQETNRRHS
jgi:uncharacterized protein (TIGR01777 family)